MDKTRNALRRSEIVFSTLGTFLATIYAGQFVDISYFIEMAVLAGLFGILRIRIRNGQRLLCAACGLLIAAFLLEVHVYTPGSDAIERFASGQKTTIIGAVADEADRRPMQTKYVIAVRTLISGEKRIDVSGKVLVTDHGGWPQYEYGDILEVHGTLSRPKSSESFAYNKYLSIQDIHALVERARVKKIGTEDKNPFFKAIFATKEAFEDQINRIFPEPHASLLAGLLTGSRRGLPDDVTEDFKRTGVLHITAISGFNVTIILLVMSNLMFFMPIKWRVLPLAISLVIFTFFVGASASVVRASIMGILGLIAIFFERQVDMRLLILWTASFMTMWNPAYLWFDAGFQLSFAALIGLTEISPHMQRHLAWIPKKFHLRTALAATLGAQLGALPVSFLIFKSVSLVAPLANVIIAPLVPLAMITGFFATTLSFLSFSIGQLIGFFSFGFLFSILLIVRIIALIPFAAINVG